MLPLYPLTLWVLIVILFLPALSILVGSVSGISASSRFPKELSNDDPFRPKIRNFDCFYIFLFDDESKAFKSVVLSRDFIELHHSDSLRLYTSLHDVRGGVDVDKAEVETDRQVRALP